MWLSSAGRISISSCFQHNLQDGYLSLKPHVKGGLFPLTNIADEKEKNDIFVIIHEKWYDTCEKIETFDTSKVQPGVPINKWVPQ